MSDTFGRLVGALIERMSLAALLDILLVAVAIHILLKLIEGRRASQMAFGTLIVGGALVLTSSSQFELTTIQWIVRNTLPYLGIALIVLYQAEIRRGLAKLGQFGGGGLSLRARRLAQDAETRTLAVLTEAAARLSRRKLGGIIVWQGKIGLGSYQDTGRSLDAALSADLLLAVFQTGSPLHDGAAIVAGNRIVAARCLLPITGQSAEAEVGGTRHRAALGLTEETDATVLVVSEETGRASVVFDGRIYPVADRADLAATLARFRPAARASEESEAFGESAPWGEAAP